MPASDTPTPNRILLADDDARSADIAVMILHNLGFSVDVVRTGAEALDYLRHNRCDLVLMNIEMPVMDGLDATRRLRDADTFGEMATLPVIGITAHSLLGDREKGLAAGMDGYITKPFSAATLQALLTRYLGPDVN